MRLVGLPATHNSHDLPLIGVLKVSIKRCPLAGRIHLFMSKPHRKSLIRQVIERLDSKMAIGESRYEAKKAARKAAQARGEKLGTYSDGLIHSHKTRLTYTEQVLRFVNCAR